VVWSEVAERRLADEFLGADLAGPLSMPSRARPNRVLAGIIAFYAMAFVGTAIKPRDFSIWLIENLLVFLFVGILVATHRRLAFTNLSYLLIAIFLSLHAIGTNTGYAHSPIGNWLKGAFELKRNYYDRLIHFAFGLLLAYPIRELLARVAGVSKRASDWYAVALIMAASSLFEVLEWNVAEIVSPGAGPDWLGAQGDVWDAHLDMLVALIGATITVLVTWGVDHPKPPKHPAPAAPKPFRERRLLHAYLAIYLLVWIFAAIDPVSRKDWLLENLLAFAGMAFLVLSYRRMAQSDLSYSLILVFALLHALGAHYTYAKVPLGFWMRDAWDLSRNHYDRVVHFVFGVLLTIPFADVVRARKLSRFWSLFLPAAVIVAWSGFFEVLEAIVAWIVSPELGQEYLGTQGDQWDAQKDMGLAIVGTALATLATPWLSSLLQGKRSGATASRK
jgi:putative membrane protein